MPSEFAEFAEKEKRMAAQPVTPDVEKVPYGLYRLPHLGSSLLQVLIPDEVRNLWKHHAWQMDSGRSARTLVKYPDLRIVLVSMKAGTSLKEHKTNARFAILTLAGHVRLHLPQASVEVPRGELLAVDHDVPHDVEAVRQSTFLLIIAWPGREKEKCHE
jgi:quercetin dioxygenase-like cupin family protein